jgi:hypothetical protein
LEPEPGWSQIAAAGSRYRRAHLPISACRSGNGTGMSVNDTARFQNDTAHYFSGMQLDFDRPLPILDCASEVGE